MKVNATTDSTFEWREVGAQVIIAKPLAGLASVIDLSLGYGEANASPILQYIIASIAHLQDR